MNKSEIIKELKKIFSEVFFDSEYVFSRDLNADDIDEWDSLTHINLIVAIEKKFDISFTLEELDSQHNVGDTIDMILVKYNLN
tara:strand:- start:299 stop:547 length:249 start_codon:yes stop_codon:yes gene_type:complete